MGKKDQKYIKPGALYLLISTGISTKHGIITNVPT
jgi:hypothetical protein